LAGWMSRVVDRGPGAAFDVHQPSAPRSFVFSTVGALIGLMVAAYALFTAKGTSTLIVPAEDVAIVNEQPIARSDYAASLRALYAASPAEVTAEQRHQVLNDLVREELFVQRAKELDVAAFDPEVRAAMARSVEESVAADAVTRIPNEPQLRTFYAANRDRYANEGVMTLRDLVFSPGQALAAAKALREGRRPDEVLSEFSGHDSQAVKGEEFYFAAKIHLGEPLFLAARGLPNGGVAGPIAAADGDHVLFMVQNHVPPPFSFEQARGRVQSDYTQDAINRLQSKQAEFLRKRANVRIAEDLK
jgi:hypothetical protein